MTDRNSRVFSTGASLLAAALLLTAPVGRSQATSTSPSQETSAGASKQERWLHVRVENPQSKDETVRVNVPLELAEKVLPTIKHDGLQSGKVKIDHLDCNGLDVRAMLDAVRSSKDGEFVTVQSKDQDVRVAKQGAYFLVHVVDKNRDKKSRVEVKVPMKVVDALLSGKDDELDLVAGLHALAAQGDTELVSAKDEENTVRVWLDSKNVSD